MLLFLIFTFNCVAAKSNIKNNYNIEINDSNYNVLKSYMNDDQMERLSPRAYEEIMNGNVDSYQSVIIASTYYFSEPYGKYMLAENEIVDDYDTYAVSKANECSKLSSYRYTCETEYKYMQLLVSTVSGKKKFHIINQWK